MIFNTTGFDIYYDKNNFTKMLELLEIINKKLDKLLDTNNNNEEFENINNNDI